MSDDDSNIVRFRSGRWLYAHAGVVGLDPKLELHTGYDDFHGTCLPGSQTDQHGSPNADDMRELADLMIARWTRFKETLP